MSLRPLICPVLKKILPQILVLSLVIAQVPMAYAALGDDKNQTSTQTQSVDPTPVVYQVQGDENVVDGDGISHQVSAAATTYQPNTIADLDGLVVETERQIQDDENKKTQNIFLLEGADGQLAPASKASFLAGFREANRIAFQDAKNILQPTLIVLRGWANYYATSKSLAVTTVTAYAVTTTLTHNQSVVGGVTAGMLSATLLYYNSTYSKLFKIDQNYAKLLARGLASQYIYLLIIKGALYAAGAVLDPTVSDLLIHTFTESIIGTLAQTPVTVAAQNMSDSYAKNHAGETFKIGKVNFGSAADVATKLNNISATAMSGYVSWITALKISHYAHADLLSYAVGVPATVMVAYAQDWFGMKKGINWVGERVTNTQKAVSIMVSNKFIEWAGDLWERDHDLALLQIVEKGMRLKKEMREPTCQAMTELIN
jgi:hypothetical protein